MELLEIAKKRFSVRNYTNQKVEPEKLAKILEAAHVAPTAANLQPVHLIVAQSDEALAKVARPPRFMERRWQLSCVQTTTRHGCGPLTKSRLATLTPLS